jgi:hypothetical protein
MAGKNLACTEMIVIAIIRRYHGKNIHCHKLYYCTINKYLAKVRMTAKRTLSIIVLLPFAAVALFLVAALFWFYVPDPLKITNPIDPRFNPYSFKYSDYPPNRCAERERFKLMFPIGTPKKYVEEVLVKSGEAEVAKIPDTNVYSYRPTNVIFSYLYSITIFHYDENQNVEDIRKSGGTSGYSIFGRDEYC